MKPLVYLETTIPSYYCDARPELASDIARTRQWWDDERDRTDHSPPASSVGGLPVTSDSIIVDEVRRRRGQLSERYGHDLRRYAEHLRELESRYASRVVSQLTVVRPTDAPAKET